MTPSPPADKLHDPRDAGTYTTFPSSSSVACGRLVTLLQKGKSDILSVLCPPTGPRLRGTWGPPPPKLGLARHNRSKAVYDDLGFWGTRNFTIQIFENFCFECLENFGPIFRAHFRREYPMPEYAEAINSSPFAATRPCGAILPRRKRWAGSRGWRAPGRCRRWSASRRPAAADHSSV